MLELKLKHLFVQSKGGVGGSARYHAVSLQREISVLCTGVNVGAGTRVGRMLCDPRGSTGHGLPSGEDHTSLRDSSSAMPSAVQVNEGLKGMRGK